MPNPEERVYKMLSSDDTTALSLPSTDSATFSDEAAVDAYSPPSSPPDVSWIQDGQSTSLAREKKSARNSTRSISAFAVLGKRKRPLSPICHNARTSNRMSTPQPALKTKAPPLVQLQISVGQQVYKKCRECGMDYIASSADDRKLHDQYHKQSSEGCDVGKDFVRKSRPDAVVSIGRERRANDAKSTDLDAVCVVDRSDAVWKKKRVKDVLDMVQKSLGAVEIPESQLWESCTARHALGRYRMYVYLRGTKCVGAALVESISTARRAVDPARSMRREDVMEVEGQSALEKLRARRARSSIQDDRPVQLAVEVTPAMIGISRIWTAPSCQKQGIAVKLLDILLEHEKETNTRDRTLTKDMIAFSQPTTAGTRLARKWFGKRIDWLVYVD